MVSKILYAWELGDDIGHAGQFFSIAKEFIRRGHEVYFVVRDLSHINFFDWPAGIIFLQAPIWPGRIPRAVATRCYAENLLYRGYQSSGGLSPLVSAWRNIFTLISPDLIIIDDAPTALLASSALGIPRVIFGNAFIAPSPGLSSTQLRPWIPVDETRMVNNEHHVVDVINAVATTMHLPKVNYVSDLFFAEKVIFSGFNELDFYRSWRADAIYYGSHLLPDVFEKPEWVCAASAKVFAYLKYGAFEAENILAALARLDANVVCFYAGAKPEQWAKYEGASMVFSNRPYDMSTVYARADSIICHAGNSVVSSAMYYGCPMILLPNQIEQYNTACAAFEIGSSIIINKDEVVDTIEKRLREFFTNPIYKEKAKIFAEKIKHHSPSHTVALVCDECESLLG